MAEFIAGCQFNIFFGLYIFIMHKENIYAWYFYFYATTVNIPMGAYTL
jgi:hypothetical protein